MLRINRLFTAFVTCFLLLCLSASGDASTAIAKTTASDLLQVRQARTLPYSGLLTNLDGKNVADGMYDFTFSLYDAPENGNLLWTENQSGVLVNSGDFTTNLGQTNSLPESVFSYKALWIEVSVRGPGESAFTQLSPRKMISLDAPAETNSLTCPHSHFTDSWTGTTSGYGLLVDNSTGTGDGIRTLSGATSNNNAAIFAINVATSGAGRGIWAGSINGTGIFSVSTNDNGLEATTDAPLGNNKSAIYAHANDANGVYATSITQNGIYATSSNAFGVYGISTNSQGVYGSSSNGQGVHGYSATSFGVYGDTGRSDQNYGIYTPNNLYSLNYHLAGAVMQVVQNGGTEALEPGDVAVFVGIVAPQEENGTPIIQVAKSTEANSTAVAGVVYSRIDSKVLTGGLQPDGSGVAGLDLTPAGPVNPGEYLLLVVQGPAQVKVSALSGTIETGDLLSTAGQAGYLAPATQITIEGIQMAVPGTILGIALEPLDKGLEDIIYIYVALH